MWTELLKKQNDIEKKDASVKDRERICNQLYAELEQWQQSLETQHAQLEERAASLDLKRSKEVSLFNYFF
jgi:peptidoglycan hydrolase CwlO-like protein